MPDGFDPALGVISRGNGLPGVTPTQATQLSPTQYALTVDSPEGSDDENLLVGVLYNGKTVQALMADAGALRGDGEVEVTVSSSWSQEDEDALFAYMFAYRIEGNGGDEFVKLGPSDAQQAHDVGRGEQFETSSGGQAYEHVFHPGLAGDQLVEVCVEPRQFAL